MQDDRHLSVSFNLNAPLNLTLKIFSQDVSNVSRGTLTANLIKMKITKQTVVLVQVMEQLIMVLFRMFFN